jgi:eukaryotic-like serine/threonine-protein kinase
MRRVLLCAALVTLAGEAFAQSMFRGDAGHTGAASAIAPREFHRLKWRFLTGGRVVSSPVFQDGVLYVGSDDGSVYALDAASGRRRWRFATAGPVASTPSVAGGLVYFMSYDGRFYAVEAESGKLRWRFTTGGERRFEAKNLHGFLPKNQTIADPFDVFLSSPVVAEGAVFFGCGDGNLYALDAATGALRWKLQTGDVVHASPAYADGVVYVGSWDSYLYAVEAESGKEKWRFRSGEDPYIHNQVGFQSSPAVVGGVVYVGCRDSNLYAIDAASGTEKWRVNNQGSWVIGSPAVTQGRVVYATSDSALFHEVDASSGKPLLKQDVKAYTFASPTVAGDVVLVGVMNGTLEARDLATGSLLWDYRTEASQRNRGWALDKERRFNNPLLFSSIWREAPILAQDRQLSVGSFVSTPLAVAGAVYVGSTDGAVYAIE